MDIAHFHTAKNFLAAGDEHVIKFWSMDDVKLLATTDADGGLPVSLRNDFVTLTSLCVCFFWGCVGVWVGAFIRLLVIKLPFSAFEIVSRQSLGSALTRREVYWLSLQMETL